MQPNFALKLIIESKVSRVQVLGQLEKCIVINNWMVYNFPMKFSYTWEFVGNYKLQLSAGHSNWAIDWEHEMMYNWIGEHTYVYSQIITLNSLSCICS